MKRSGTIHWLGCGLSSGPGIVALANAFGRVHVWDMTTTRADALNGEVRDGAEIASGTLNLADAGSRSAFVDTVVDGDIIVSMLPPSLHIEAVKIALERGAHVVLSSYLADDIQACNDEAVEKDLAIVAESGLDPGIDHLFAHILTGAAREAGVLGTGARIEFSSYCGGVPVVASPFTYKFSWTPLGVLSALMNPAKVLLDGEVREIARPWEFVSLRELDGETFEVYPNRDSLPFIAEYGLADEGNLSRFVRGTLRLEGWKEAWSDVFQAIENANTVDDLRPLSDKLWSDYAYTDDEEDRVILSVELKATQSDGTVWQGRLTIDQCGSGWQSAMASAVSLTIAEAVEAIANGRLQAGVQTPPSDPTEAARWLSGLRAKGIVIRATGFDVDFL